VHYSPETAVNKVSLDILILPALDSGNLAMLTLFYLSAACDSAGHHTLLCYESPTVLTGRTGLHRISASERFNKFALQRPVPRYHHQQFYLEYHKVQSSDRSCFFCTLPTCCGSTNVSYQAHAYAELQTTPRFRDTVSRPTLACSLAQPQVRFLRG